MAKYIDLEREFECIQRIGRSLIETNKTLPAAVFRGRFDFYRFIDIGWLFSARRRAWDTILSFARELTTGPIYLLALNPAPESYYAWCGKYGAIGVDLMDQPSDVLQILSESPKEGTGDAMAFTASRFVTFSEGTDDWCLWADREYDVAVVGGRLSATCPGTEKMWRPDIWLDAERALDTLFVTAFPDGRIPDDFRAELSAQYRGRGQSGWETGTHHSFSP